MDSAIQPAAPSTPPADEIDWTGQVLGPFRLLFRLGRGGMGQVYLAEQINLKRKVALKLLSPELAVNERSLLRFKAEAENVARATHANIVQVYDIGEANGINYIALEYVEGRNLREFIEKKGTPELSLGLHIMAQVAAALQRASELGIIHRDVKPENILLTKKGEVKVADFGLSRCFAEESQQSITQSQVAMGTPLYMSPEQVERKTVDTRTDIYSFGVTCYHMFAGTPPFKGNSPIEVAYQHVHKEPQDLTEVRPDLPASLCAIISRMMAKKPEDRYQSAREILRDINQLREALNLGTIAAISISSSFIGSATDVGRNSPTQSVITPAPANRWLWRGIGVAAVVIALAGGIAFGWYRNVKGLGQGILADPDAKKNAGKSDIREREKQLQERVRESLNAENKLDKHFGLKACVDLGLFCLEHRRLEEANNLFQELAKPERKVAGYSYLGKLGRAMVLAFKDEPDESNKQFDKFFTRLEKIEAKISGGGPGAKLEKSTFTLKDELDAYGLLWRDNPAIREMVAKALHHNFANDPKHPLVQRLKAYSSPPLPTLKAPPANP